MQEIRKKHKNYGCVRMTNELKKYGFHVNKKKVQHLIKKLQQILLNLSISK